MTDEQTTEHQDESTESVLGRYHRRHLTRLGWQDLGNGVWSKPESTTIVHVADGSAVVKGEECLSGAELRAFAGLADSERKDPTTGERMPEPPLLNLPPEQRALADNLAQRFAVAGIPCSSDEAQLIATIADLGRQTIDKSEGQDTEAPVKLRTKKTTELCSGNTRLSQVCLAILAKLTVRQHVSGYANDVNLRALDIIDTMLHVLAVLAPDKKKMRHPHG